MAHHHGHTGCVGMAASDVRHLPQVGRRNRLLLVVCMHVSCSKLRDVCAAVALWGFPEDAIPRVRPNGSNKATHRVTCPNSDLHAVQQQSNARKQGKKRRLYTVPGTRYQVHGTRYTVHGTRYTVHGTRYTVHGTRYTVHDTRYGQTEAAAGVVLSVPFILAAWGRS